MDRPHPTCGEQILLGGSLGQPHRALPTGLATRAKRRPLQEDRVPLPARTHFCGKHPWIAGARIARRSKQYRFAEASRPKLIKEGAAFFGSGDSSEPIVIGDADFGGRRRLA